MGTANDDLRGPSESRVDPLDSSSVLALFAEVSDRAAEILESNQDWTMSGGRATQYSIDVDVDVEVVAMLHAAGLPVLSEETGLTEPSRGGAAGCVVVVDPLDGSTNASRGLPWCATALCLVVDDTPTVAMVTNLRTGTRYHAVVGDGAWRDGRRLQVAAGCGLADAIVAVNARPPDDFHPAQYRSMGATALDIAAVADGGFDGSIDFDDDMIGVWDYLAAVTILEEAGGVAADALGRPLMTLEHSARRRPVTATSTMLLDVLLEWAGPGPAATPQLS